MFQEAFSKRLLPRLCAAALIVPLASTIAHAQCNCASTLTFGSCAIKKVQYPDQFPGAAVVVVRPARKYLYVADMYNGFTYRFDPAAIENPTADNPKKLASPKGSQSTTGIAARTEGDVTLLYWAIEGRLYRSDLEAANVSDLGFVEIGKLAQFLKEDTQDSSIQIGTLGGITYHEGRGAFWGVDIVNDVYFEFGLDGKLTLKDGRPNYFFNPKSAKRYDKKLPGGAYGNWITYAASGGAEYFDIPVGSLTDRKPVEVRRVYATETEDHKIGDDAGIAYLLGSAFTSPKFVTGIAFWPDSCGAGQASEFMLDLDQVGGNPKIFQVTADEPAAANVGDFHCARGSELASVVLQWQKTRQYTTLKITRQRIDKTGEAAVTLREFSDFANDPEELTDTGVLDGTYEYVATVTAAAPVVASSCRTTVGPGTLLACQHFSGAAGSSDPTPFAVTVADSDTSKLVIVADLNTGDAQTFDLDLNPVGTINGPFASGLTTGIGYNPANKMLYWAQNLNGRHSLQKTDVSGGVVGGSDTLAAPTNYPQGMLLGNFGYDAVRDIFWTIDLLNSGILAYTSLGKIVNQFKAKEISSPEPTGILSGGIAVSAATQDRVTLDIALGKQAAGIVDQIGTFEYDPANINAAAKEIRRLDLRGSVGSADVAGIAFHDGEEQDFEYVVGMDTCAVYKLRLSTEVTGVRFQRGDINNDDTVNISDPTFLLLHLYRAGQAPACLRAADVERTDTVDLSDAIYLFNYLFKGGPAPAAPFPTCGVDQQSTLACDQVTCTD